MKSKGDHFTLLNLNDDLDDGDAGDGPEKNAMNSKAWAGS